MTKKHNDAKPMGCSKSSSKKEFYSNTIPPQETRKISNKQPKLTPKVIREREQTKPKVSRRKQIIKIRAKVNEIETKKIGTFLVAQWLRILLPMQWTGVRSPVQEDPTCHGATKPMHHNY